MAQSWYKCIKTAPWDGAVRTAGRYYLLNGTPPVAYFQADTGSENRRVNELNFFNAEKDDDKKFHVYDSVEFEQPVELNGGPTAVDCIDFNLSSTYESQEGRMCWDADEDGAVIGMPGGNVNQSRC